MGCQQNNLLKGSFRRTLLAAAVTLIACVSASAQKPKDEESPKVEMAVTYVYQRTDKNPGSVNVNGFSVSPTFEVSSRVGVITSFSYGRSGSQTFGTISSHSDSYQVGGGLGVTLAKSARVKFGLEGEVGLQHQREKFSTGAISSNNSTYVFVGPAVDLETPNPHVSVRLIRIGWEPTFSNGDRQDNLHVETGLIFNFGHRGK